MLVTVTAYICMSLTCKNAMGLTPKIGSVACPRNMPFGTEVCIDGKKYTCQDRTAKRLDGRYDIFYGYGQEAYNQAIKFGKRKLMVYEIKK